MLLVAPLHLFARPKIIVSMFDNNLVISANEETACLNAVFWVMLGSSVVERFEDLQPLVAITKTHHMEPQDADLYDSLYWIHMEF